MSIFGLCGEPSLVILFLFHFSSSQYSCFYYCVVTYRHALRAGSSDLRGLRRSLGTGGRGPDPRSVPVVDDAVVRKELVQ